MTFRALAVFALCMTIALPAAAQMARLGNRGERVPMIELPTLSQRATEDQSAYLSRVAGWMHNYTSGTNEEVCANICKTPDGAMSVRLLTNKSHLACGLADLCAPGSVLTADSIHSHPLDENFRINDADRAFMRDRSPGRHIQRRSSFISDSEKFSEFDYANGPGYLVAKGRLLYQAGRGTERVVQANIVPAPLSDAPIAKNSP